MPRMKITMQSSLLADMVSVCSMAISSKPMKPIYECVYLEANSDKSIPLVTVVGKDSGTAIRKVTDKAEVMEDGQALIPAKTLLNFLKLMDGEVTLAVEGITATLKSKGKKVNITCLPGAEYEPGFTQIKQDQQNLVTMNGADWGTLTNSVSHCISVDQGRLILTGVSLKFNGEAGTVEACGVDGYKVAICRKSAETNDTFAVVVPGVSAKLVEKVIKDAENVDYCFGSGVMIAEAYDTAIEVSMLQGSFVEYEKMLVKNGSLRAKVNTSELLTAVKLAQVSASEGQKNLIVLTFTSDEALQVTARADKSASTTDVVCVVDGELMNPDKTSAGREIAFNANYISDCLKAASGFGDEVTLLCNSPVSPMAILPVDRNDFYQLVLPVRRG